MRFGHSQTKRKRKKLRESAEKAKEQVVPKCKKMVQKKAKLLKKQM
jgi:hypothetical protein